jgi:hypothetical protein
MREQGENVVSFPSQQQAKPNTALAISMVFANAVVQIVRAVVPLAIAVVAALLLFAFLHPRP